MRKTLSLTLCVLLCTHIAAQTRRKPKITLTPKSEKQLTLVEAIEIIRPSIIQIVGRAYPSSGAKVETSTRKVLGTAFIVSTDGYAVTARHVLHPALPENVKKVDFYASVPVPNYKDNYGNVLAGNFQEMPFRIQDEDEEHDLALLKLEGQPTGFIKMRGVTPKPITDIAVSLSESEAKEGLSIALSGYPFESDVLIT